MSNERRPTGTATRRTGATHETRERAPELLQPAHIDSTHREMDAEIIIPKGSV